MSKAEQPVEFSRRIKSFVVRGRRMTSAQQQAFDLHLQQWGLTTTNHSIAYTEVFDNSHPFVLEIGFGMGDSLAQMAAENPNKNFIGVEVHTPGVGRLLSLVEKEGLKNIRVYNEDAIKVLELCISPYILERINIYFPDPWHKTKHHKRRLVNPSFLALAHSKLKSGGLLHIATDWQPYAEYILKIMGEQKLFENIAGADLYIDREAYGRAETKFERRGQNLGHGVWDMGFQALPAPLTK